MWNNRMEKTYPRMQFVQVKRHLESKGDIYELKKHINSKPKGSLRVKRREKWVFILA